MPFTPFHFGPNLALSIPFHRWLDVLAFTFASVAVDIEPLCVMVFDLDYPLHGYAHTFLGALVVGTLFGLGVYFARNPISKALGAIHLDYTTTLPKSLLGGSLGACFHVLVDSPLYGDIRPLFPLQYNPFYDLYSFEFAHIVGGVLGGVFLCMFLGWYLWKHQWK